MCSFEITSLILSTNRQLRKFIHQKQKMRYSSRGFKKDCAKSLGLMPILSSLRFDSFTYARKLLLSIFLLCMHVMYA